MHELAVQSFMRGEFAGYNFNDVNTCQTLYKTFYMISWIFPSRRTKHLLRFCKQQVVKQRELADECFFSQQHDNLEAIAFLGHGAMDKKSLFSTIKLVSVMQRASPAQLSYHHFDPKWKFYFYIYTLYKARTLASKLQYQTLNLIA